MNVLTENLNEILQYLSGFLGNETNARNLEAEALSGNQIRATWEVSPYNCDVFGYRVHYYEVDNPQHQGM